MAGNKRSLALTAVVLLLFCSIAVNVKLFREYQVLRHDLDRNLDINASPRDDGVDAASDGILDDDDGIPVVPTNLFAEAHSVIWKRVVHVATQLIESISSKLWERPQQLPSSLQLRCVMESVLAGDTQVVPLNNEGSFDELMANHRFVFVAYIMPWSVWCRQLLLVWKEFASSHQLGVPIAVVNCEENPSLCARESVPSFPTMRLYKEGIVSGPDYRSDRTVAALTEYVQEHLNEDKNMGAPLSITPDFTTSEDHELVLVHYCMTAAECNRWEALEKPITRMIPEVAMAWVGYDEHPDAIISGQVLVLPTLRMYRNGKPTALGDYPCDYYAGDDNTMDGLISYIRRHTRGEDLGEN